MTTESNKALSAYKITWVEFRPQSGKATRKDCCIFAGWQSNLHSADVHTRCYYKHFPTKDKALAYLKSFDRKLTKSYECRLFTDKQFSMRRREDGYKVPFTKQQIEEVYRLG